MDYVFRVTFLDTEFAKQFRVHSHSKKEALAVVSERVKEDYPNLDVDMIEYIYKEKV